MVQCNKTGNKYLNNHKMLQVHCHLRFTILYSYPFISFNLTFETKTKKLFKKEK